MTGYNELPQNPDETENEKYNSVYNLFNPKKTRKRMLNVMDSLISIFVVCPCVVGSWRGLWMLTVIYEDRFPGLESALTGIGIIIIFSLVQHLFHDFVINSPQNIFVIVLSKLYMYVFFVAVILNWGGLWLIHDHYFNIQFSEQGIVLPLGMYRHCLWLSLACLLILFGLKCVINISGPPFLICMDFLHESFLFPSYFKTKVSRFFYS